MSMADATATVVQQVFARLVRDGTLPRAVFDDIAAAHDRMADETLIDVKATDARAVADVAQLVLTLSEDTTVKHGLRLVPAPDAGRDE